MPILFRAATNTDSRTVPIRLDSNITPGLLSSPEIVLFSMTVEVSSTSSTLDSRPLSPRWKVKV